MNTALPLFLIGFVFGGGIGFTIAAANGFILDGHDHSDPAHHETSAAHGKQDTHQHNHGQPLVLSADAGSPTLSLDVIKDPVAGYNLHIQTSNFTFSPENASRPHVDGQGHAHVYVNGTKVARVYGPWVHLDGLPAGPVTVEVTLNSNDHRTLTVADTPLMADITISN